MRCLVLSGGGSKGNFQTGALKYLLNELEINYDAFCGVSVGALNSAFLSMFKTGEEKLAYSELEALWKRVDTDKIYKKWCPLGMIQGLWKSSLYNSKPLLDWIDRELAMDKVLNSGKTVVVGTVSLTSGKYQTFDQNYPQFVKAVAASSSFPGMLIPIEMGGELWSDGGVREVTPLQSAIDLGATTIDIIMTSPEKNPNIFPKNPNAIDVLMRTVDLMMEEIIANDLDKALLYNELVAKHSEKAKNKRIVEINIIRPKDNLIDNSLDFTPAKLAEMAEKGYNEAKLVFNSK